MSLQSVECVFLTAWLAEARPVHCQCVYSELLHWLGAASIGISTMVEEHFGINIVEFMVRVSLAVSLCK
jgi:hypothetical protein